MSSVDFAADDLRARERITTSLDESLLVEAAAGTGKTTQLVARLVALIESGKAEIDTVVAVTFTRKAAGELKLRIREALDRRLSSVREDEEGPVTPEVVKRLEQAIARLETARIGTIHSLCAEILRERPVEAGVDPGFEEVADDEAPRLYRLAFDRWIQQRLQLLPQSLRRALSRLALDGPTPQGGPLDRLRDAGWGLIEWRDFTAPWKRPEYDRQAEIEELLDIVEKFARLLRLGESRRDPLKRAMEPVELLANWLERTLAVRGAAPLDHDALEARLLKLQRDLRSGASKRDGRGKFAEGVPREQVVNLRDLLIDKLERFRLRADADLAARLKDEMQGLLERYEKVKIQTGVVDFADLLLLTRDLLRNHEHVRRHLQQRIGHLFVDEFQDTDPLQAEILLLLAADDPAVEDWREARPTPGKLFLVGDPKQSIYRFRRADLELYDDVKQQLLRHGVGLAFLTRSFRSVATIQRFVNHAFAPEMTGDPEARQADYVPLSPFREAPEDQPAVVVLPPPRPYGYRGIARYRIEQCQPDATAAFVEWLVNESGWKVPVLRDGKERRVAIKPSDVCLLFRRFSSWGRDVTRDYTRGLEGRGIPHVLIGARTFHQREEVEGLRAVLEAIERPDDELAVFATLRGTFFAFSDELLFRVREEVGPLHPVLTPIRLAKQESAQKNLSELGDELGSLVGVLERLASLHLRRNQRAIVETLHEILELTRAHAGLALRPAGQQVLGNVQRVCDLARAYELAGGVSFRGFVDRLAAEADRPTAAQAPVVEEGAEGVRVMTVHAAKGLEFPVVILADMTARRAPLNPDRTIDSRRGLCASRLLGWSPLELSECADLERRREDAEGVRVAYVAATRARDLLVVPGVGDEPLNGWLDPLNRAIYPDGGERRDAQSAAGCPDFGHSSVLERPVDHDGRPEASVRPGRYRRAPEGGSVDDAYDVVWWDPALLPEADSINYGLRHEEILVDDVDGSVAELNGRRYRRWLERQEEIRSQGALSELPVFAVTELEVPAPGEQAVSIERSRRGPRRARGRRFGSLVHAVMGTVRLDADAEEILELAELQGRIHDAPREEVSAAAQACEEALHSPWVERSRRAERVLRECPFRLRVDGSQLASRPAGWMAEQFASVEGVIDLAYLEDGVWTAVDFKTDELAGERTEAYENQLSWYLLALRELTDNDAKGVLLLV